jgi:hypothetical protein
MVPFWHRLVNGLQHGGPCRPIAIFTKANEESLQSTGFSYKAGIRPAAQMNSNAPAGTKRPTENNMLDNFEVMVTVTEILKLKLHSFA